MCELSLSVYLLYLYYTHAIGLPILYIVIHMRSSRIYLPIKLYIHKSTSYLRVCVYIRARTLLYTEIEKGRAKNKKINASSIHIYTYSIYGGN